MKRKISISASFQGVIATGPFENSRPSFSAAEEFEIEADDKSIDAVAASTIEVRHGELQALCYNAFKNMEQMAAAEKIQKEFKHLRILDCPNCGKKHPSITTIRDFDRKAFYCTDEELEIAIALGCIQDIRCREFVKTGQWLKAEQIPLCKPHLLTLKGKTVGHNDFDFPAFLAEFPITDMQNGERMWDCENEITFEPDLIATTKGWNIGTKTKPVILEDLTTVFDYKRNVDKDSAFIQMSVCAKKLGLKRMVAIPVNGETQQGYSKPIISNDVNGYFEIALEKRRQFRKRYGI